MTIGLPIDEQNHYFFDLGPKVTFGLIIKILLRVIPGLYRLTEFYSIVLEPEVTSCLLIGIPLKVTPRLPIVAEFC